jgi:hypothetical protein
MPVKLSELSKPGFLFLIALMGATRVEHFGSQFQLPDASLAVFFLCGLGAFGVAALCVLILEAGIIDFLSITQMGISDFCVSGAYIFLIPAYSLMWIGGRKCLQFSNSILSFVLLRQFVILVVMTIGAFFISNTSFFLLSGYFPGYPFLQYVDGWKQYFPPFLLATLCYWAVVTSAYHGFRGIFADRILQKTL